MAKPILGIFREKRDIEEFVFKASHYEAAYNELYELLDAKGVKVVYLMGQSTYTGAGTFSKHWIQVGAGGSFRYEKQGSITVDAVYDKDHFRDDGKVLKVNNDALYQLCWSKEKTYEVLGEFHPKSYLVTSEDEFNAALVKLPGERVAIKALTGSSGLGVFVGSKLDAQAEQQLLEYPLLVQEYIETSAGVPGLADGRHDIRVLLLNGVPVVATLRTPPEGQLKSNIGYGGAHRLLGVEELPGELLELCRVIDKKLEGYGKFRIYSVDCGLTPNGWRMFEANGMPGVINRNRGPQAVQYQEALTDFLKKIANYGAAERQKK